MIELKNISKIYKVAKEDFYALRNVNLHIGAGEFVAVQGASGSGKTTLLNIIGCMDTASEGTYCLDGEDVSGFSDEKASQIRNQRIGFVLQDFALINRQTVLYNVMLPALLGKTPYRRIKGMAIDVLEQVGLSDQATKKVNQLSGGQRQRVAIARALINRPALLLADEPTGQLDSETGKQIMELLMAQNRKGITVIVVTHDATVAAYTDRIITVSDGQILSDLKKEEQA